MTSATSSTDHLFNQTPDSPTPENRGATKLYDWTEEGTDGCADAGGCLRLASVKPDGTPLTTSAAVPGIVAGGGFTTQPSAVSADGRRIYFQDVGDQGIGFTGIAGCEAPPATSTCARTAQTTFDVSRSECTLGAACGADDSFDPFLWANPAGDVAIFKSCAKLTDASAAAASMRRYSAGEDARQALPLGPQTRPGDRLDRPHRRPRARRRHPAGVRRHRRRREDGEAVYFVAAGQLVAGEPTGASGTD